MFAREIDALPASLDESRAAWNRYRFQTLCDMASPLRAPSKRTRQLFFRVFVRRPFRNAGDMKAGIQARFRSSERADEAASRGLLLATLMFIDRV
jgi:hypothetical protein